MLKSHINWKRPLFYLILPVLIVLVFVGFPIPVAPPPSMKPGQEQSSVVKKRKRRTTL
ncbi:MAG: hypothetical protein V4463_05650 [Pseudomonadota bacterium]